MKRPAKHNSSVRAKSVAISYLLVGLCLLFGAYGAQAAYITFNNEITNDLGVGFGNVLQTLALQQDGSATSQSGSVIWNGTSDVLSGDAKPQSQTVTVAELDSMGFDASNLLVILNLNQTGSYPWLDLHSFTMRFYTSVDGSSYFDAVYELSDPRNTGSTLGLTPQGNGLGTGQAGYVFRITFEGTEGSDFLANEAHRIGVLVETPMDREANAGTEIFYMGDADVHQVIPEPATLLVLIFGGLVAFTARTVRRHQIAAR